MKKVLLILSVLLLVAMLLPMGTVFAEEPNEREKLNCKVCEVVKQIDKVKDCKALVIRGNAFIAVKIGGIATKTSAEKVEAEIVQAVKEISGITEVYVTNSVKAFSAMESFQKGVRLDEIVEMFDIDLSQIFPPRDIKTESDARCYSGQSTATALTESEKDTAQSQKGECDNCEKIPQEELSGENVENSCDDCEKGKLKKLPFKFGKRNRPQGLPKWSEKSDN